MRGRRVLLLDAPHLQAWRGSSHRFADIARQLAGRGCEVTLAVVGPEMPSVALQAEAGLSRIQVEPLGMPLICGSGRASHSRGLRDAYAVAARFGGESFDRVIAPLRGGLAFGLLMQRATGGRGISGSIALWCDVPARWCALHDDASIDVGILMDDALERASLRMADALIAPHPRALARVESLGERLPPAFTAALPRFRAAPDSEVHAGGWAGDIVFVGPLTRRAGALAFMDALELLAAAGHLNERRVTFVGPSEENPHGIGLTTLGRRAMQWPFRFELRNTADPQQALALLQDHPGLLVCPGGDDEDDRLPRTLRACGCRVIGADGPAGNDAAALAQTILNADGVNASSPNDAIADWADVVGQLPSRAPSGEPRKLSASVCIATRGRTQELKLALQSVVRDARPGLELLIADNAGETPLDLVALDIPPHIPVRMVRYEALVSQSAALNRLASVAAGDALVFLDDDNLLLPGGLGRFLDAVVDGRFDIAVTTLELADGDAVSGTAAGCHMFAGDPGMAGLFFNGFGDTSLAIRRAAFQRIGGFSDPGHQHAALDWILLAKARAAGLRIGVLIEPAIRYARRIGIDEGNWRKHDLEGARRAVAEAYGSAIDAPLLARFAQSLHLDAD
jgi:hypothetical protein